MSETPRRGPDQVHADRHRQLHRLPGMPGRLQAVERARRRETELEADLGFQNPAALSAKTLHADRVPRVRRTRTKPGGLESAYVMQRCLHCLEPACVSACPTTALERQADGPVVVRGRRVHRLPLLHAGVSLGRADRGLELARAEDLASARTAPTAPRSRRRSRSTGRRCPTTETSRFAESHRDSRLRQGVPRRRPALRHARGDARALRTSASPTGPDKYVDHIYGEKELGGTSVLYLSRRAVREARIPDVGEKPFPAFTKYGARRRSACRDGRGRPARRHVRVLPEARSSGRGWLGAEALRTTATSNSSPSRASC